jgi:hypothetical protein
LNLLIALDLGLVSPRPQPLVGSKSQEFRELLRHDEGFQEVSRVLVPALAVCVVADYGPDLLELLGNDPAEELGVDLAPVVEPGVGRVHPLPELGAGDLGRRRVLHQVVDAHRAAAPEPGPEVDQRHADVVADAVLRDPAAGDREAEEVRRADLHVLAHDVELVRPLAEDAVEDLTNRRHQVRVGHPGAVEPVGGLALLVLADLHERPLVNLGVLPAGDERGHAADGVGTAPVAGLDEELRVGAHEAGGHGDLRAVGEQRVLPLPELLDDAEDVVPATRVQPRRMLAQLVEDLVHLEDGEDRLDQARRLDRAARDAQHVLRVAEDLVPEASLEVALHLRQIEEGAVRASRELPRVVEEVEPEVEERGRDGPPVHGDVLLRKVPAARAHEERRGLVGEPVLPPVGPGELDGAVDDLDEVPLPLDHVAPSRRVRVLQVGHEDAGARVQGVDHHLPVDGTVISTRRSRSTSGTGSTFQSAARMSAVSVGKSGSSPASILRWTSARRERSWRRRSPNRRSRSATSASASEVRTSENPGESSPRTATPSGGVSATMPSPPQASTGA